jgi:hypothetical protein
MQLQLSRASPILQGLAQITELPNLANTRLPHAGLSDWCKSDRGAVARRPFQNARSPLLDFHDPQTTLILNTQDVLLGGRIAGRTVRASQMRGNHRGWHPIAGPASVLAERGRGSPGHDGARSLPGQLLHLIGLGHPPTCRSIRHACIRTKQVQKVQPVRIVAGSCPDQ